MQHPPPPQKQLQIPSPPSSPQISLTDLLSSNLIYEGQFCDVYTVNKNGKEYAVKAIDTSRMTKSQYQEQFTRICKEIRVLYGIRHFGVVELLGHFQDGGVICLVFLRFGRPISEFIKEIKKNIKNRLLPLNTFIKIFRNIGSAITEIHAMGYIHRDISEDNILIDENYNTKIIDFGCIGDIQYEKGMFGTREYLSPEVINGRTYNHKVDVWSFGILMYELMYGMYLFKPKAKNLSEEEITEQYIQNMKQPIQDPPDDKLMVDEKPSPELMAHIKSMLQYNPDKRPQIGYLLSLKIFGADEREAFRYITQQFARQKTYSKTVKANKSLSSNPKQMSVRELEETLLGLMQLNSQELGKQKQLILELAKQERNLVKAKLSLKND